MLFNHLKALHLRLAPKLALNQFAGFMASQTHPTIKNFLIQRFLANYDVNMSEAVIEDPFAYPSFNDFFIRKLKPETRPIAQANIVSPVDGAISELGDIDQGQIIQAKGHQYTVEELLATGPGLARQFLHGKFITLYLSPKDYHRVHMPLTGTLKEMVYLPGKLFPVRPKTAAIVPKLFARNERLVALFDTEIGLMAMVLVGAAIVGSISTQWGGQIPRSRIMQRTPYGGETPLQLKQGAEMGYFKLGSTVVLLFADGKKVNFKPEWKAGVPIKLGEALA